MPEAGVATATVVKADADDAKRYWLKEGWAPGGFVREVDFAANSRGVDPLFAGTKIVDCDTHFTEPKDLWTANVPAGLKVMFETDFPHPTSLYPGVQDKLVETLGGYDFATRKRVLQSNAADLYNLTF
jgi:hypothetical protein